MSFAKKFTRRIAVDGETYLWYLRDNSLESEPRRIAIRKAVIPKTISSGQILIVDPFPVPCVLGFEIRPRVIREVILFGLAHGWQPSERAQPFFLDHDGDQWLKL